MPRSPSRDRSDPFDGNRRYFARPERPRRARYVLAAAALVLAGLWAAAEVAAPARTAFAHTHGPLANPHAAWDDNCAACHVPHASSEFGVGTVFAAGDRWHDLTCGKCHAGPAHAAGVDAQGQRFHDRCSNCHHDHGGRANSLTRIPDSHCTGCHADLAANHAARSPAKAPAVTNFVTGHPEFRPLAGDPDRGLKFSHALHMTPGQVRSSGDKSAVTVARLRELGGDAAVARYAPGSEDTALVTLDCGSCHRPDSGHDTPGFGGLRAALDAAGEPAKAVLPARPPGAHFLPVNFELHCRACHPLRAGEGATGAKGVAGFDLPHRRQPSQLEGDIRAGYLRRLLAADRPELAAPAEPGGRTDGAGPGGPRTIREEVDRLTATAMTRLTAGDGCAKCHDAGGGKVEPVPDRTVWFRSARFDHTRHRGMTCAECHPNTGAAFVAPGALDTSARIAGIDTCRVCHSPAGTKVVRADGSVLAGGGVRHGCTDCHTYHAADHGLWGRGAAARAPARPNTLTEFLRGPKGPP
jgi:hypothetical protein